MDERLFHLLDAYQEHRLTEAEFDELRERLRTSAEAKRAYWEYFDQAAMIEELLCESSERDLAKLESGKTDFLTTPVAGPSGMQSRRWIAIIAASLAACVLIAVGLLWRPGPDLSQPQPNPSESEPFATVRSVVGDVQLADASGKTMPANVKDSIRSGQVINVGDDESQIEILLADGTQITLSSGSTLRFSDGNAKDKERLHLEKGAMQVQSDHPAPKAQVVVTTAHARIVPAATRFRLYHEENSSRVELEKGKMSVERLADNTSVEMTEGSFVVARTEEQPLTPQPMPISHCLLRHTFLRAGDAAVFSPDGSRLLTHHFSRGWKAWSTLEGKQIASTAGTDQGMDGYAFTGADSVIALSKTGLASFWKVGAAQVDATKLRDKDVRHGAVSADGRWLAQAIRGLGVAIWEADPQKESISLRQSLMLQPSRVAISTTGPKGPQVAVSQWGGEIRIFDVKTGLESAQFRMKYTPIPLALSADSRFVAAYANEEGLVLFDQDRKTSQNFWPGVGARVSSLFFSADGRVLFAGLEDGTVRAWSTGDGQCLFVLETGHRRVGHVSASADLSLITTCGDGSCVKIWECKLP